MRIELVLPWPPSANQMYRHVGAKVLISERGRKYRLEVAEVLARAGSPRLKGALSLTLLVFPPDNRRRDLDGLPKNLQDSLMLARLFEDDSQIVELHVLKRANTPGGRVLAVVEEIETNATKEGNCHG